MPLLTEPALAAVASHSSLQCQQPQTALVCPALGERPLAAASPDGMWWSDPAGLSWLPCGDVHWVAGLSAAASCCSGGCICLERGLAMAGRAATLSGPDALLLLGLCWS